MRFNFKIIISNIFSYHFLSSTVVLNVFLVHDISYIFVLEGTLYYITDVCFACLPFSFDLTNRELDKMRDFLLNISKAQVIDLSSYFFPSITTY